MFFSILFFLGVILFSLRIKNKKLYYYSKFGDYFPVFKESAIRITKNYITVKILEKPSFFIWWKDFDVIKIIEKTKKYKIFQKLSRKKYKVQFYSFYQNYNKDFKFISGFELSTRHFSLLKCEEIIAYFQKFATSLNKKLILDN